MNVNDVPTTEKWIEPYCGVSEAGADAPLDVLEAQRHQAEAQTQQGRGAVVTAIWLFVTVLLTMLPDGGRRFIGAGLFALSLARFRKTLGTLV